MTFAEFIASRKHVDDVGQITGCGDHPQPGHIYGDVFYINDPAPDDPGVYTTELENHNVEGDLDEVEQRLYDYCQRFLCEGWEPREQERGGVPFFTFFSDDDVERFLRFLIDRSLCFHFDDDLDEVVWGSDVSPETVAALKGTVDRLWQWGSIWGFFDRHPGLFDLYCGTDEGNAG